MQPSQQAVQGEAAPARVDFGFDRLLRFDSEHLRQQEAKRTGRVTLELRRAELVVAVEDLRDALPVRLALEHAFVCRESRLLVPRGRHLRTRQDRARRGAHAGRSANRRKKAGFFSRTSAVATRRDRRLSAFARAEGQDRGRSTR